MIENTDNPSGRLFLILKQAQKLDEKLKTREAWAKIFDIDPKNTAEILRMLGKVNQLPSSIRKDVKSLDDVNEELYLKRLSKIENSLSRVNLNASWKRFQNSLDETSISSLEFCSDLLSNQTDEKGLSQKQLDELLELTHKFKEALLNSEVDESLKEFIFKYLNEIENAIADYKISGTEPIEAAIERSVGSVMMNKNIYARDAKWTDKFFEYISRFTTIADLYSYSVPLLEASQKFLPN